MIVHVHNFAHNWSNCALSSNLHVICLFHRQNFAVERHVSSGTDSTSTCLAPETLHTLEFFLLEIECEIL